jgi:DNA-binding MurR/RpiR family transcriptional regulator
MKMKLFDGGAMALAPPASPQPLDAPTAFARSELGLRLAMLMESGSPGQRKLAEFLLRHPIRFSALSIEELARATGVSAPTISRFARGLDAGGFATLRASVADAMQALLDPVSKLRLQLRAAERPALGGEMLDAIQQQIARLDAARIGAETAQLAAAVMRARTVHVMGFGLSAHVAGLLVLGLQPFHPGVAGVVEFGGTEVAAGRLTAIGPEDLLIAITFPRYASDVVSLTRYARARGATIAALTDSPVSPIAPLADMTLLAPSDHPTLSSSMAAAVAVAETLVAAVMLSDPANAEKAAALDQAIGAYLHKS